MPRLTDVLDLVGLLLAVAALAVLAWRLDPAAALGTAAAGLLAASWLVDRRADR